MGKFTDWKVAQKIEASGRRGIIIGLVIATIVCLVVAIGIIKLRWLKKHFGSLHCDVDELDEYLDDDEGCCYGNEKDFV